MTRTFWLSFCDPERPTGDHFLGVCVVDVTEADAARFRTILKFRFPRALPGAEWIAAATTKARQEGCNPGGEVAGYDVTDCPVPEKLAATPRNQLLSRADLEALGLNPVRTDELD